MGAGTHAERSPEDQSAPSGTHPVTGGKGLHYEAASGGSISRSTLPGPFAAAALQLHAHGLAVVPCPSDNGKSCAGAVRGFNRWKKHPGSDYIRKMMLRWSQANIGIVAARLSASRRSCGPL